MMTLNIEELPFLGLGASLSLSSRPDPVKLVKAEGGPSFVEYAGLADVDQVIEEVERVRGAGVPVLYHPSYINFCGSWANDGAWLAATADDPIYRHLCEADSESFTPLHNAAATPG